MVLIGTLALSVAAYSARGAVSYSYTAEPQGGFVILGQSNTFNLYLQETLTSGSASPVIANSGLYNAGVALVENPGGTGVTEAGQTNNNLPEPKGFTGKNSSGSLTNGGVGGWIIDTTANDATVGVSPASATTHLGTTIDLYLLGTIILNVSADADATFSVESLHDAPRGEGIGGGASELGGSVGNTLDFDADDLDLNSVNPAYSGADGHPTSLTSLMALPEPASLSLLALGGVGLLFRRRRTA